MKKTKHKWQITQNREGLLPSLNLEDISTTELQQTLYNTLSSIRNLYLPSADQSEADLYLPMRYQSNDELVQIGAMNMFELDEASTLMGVSISSNYKRSDDFSKKSYTFSYTPKGSKPLIGNIHGISLEHNGSILSIIKCNQIPDIKLKKWNGDDTSAFWYKFPNEGINEKSYFLTAQAYMRNRTFRKWPSSNKQIVNSLFYLVKSNKTDIDLLLTCLIVAAEIKSKKCISLWNYVIKQYKKINPSYSDLLDILEKSGPVKSLFYKGYLINIEDELTEKVCLSSSSCAQERCNYTINRRYEFYRNSSKSLLKTHVQGIANEGDWPFGVGVEMTWSLGLFDEDVNSTSILTNFAKKKFKKFGFVYKDGDNLEFATDVITSKSKLNESYVLATGISKIFNLPFDTDIKCGGGFHVNVSIDCSHPLHAAFALYAGYIVSSMPWLSWCLNDAWDNSTAKHLSMVGYEFQSINFGDKTNAAYFRGNRIEYRFMSMPRDMSEVHALIDLCMAITVKGKQQVLLNEPHCTPSNLEHLNSFNIWNDTKTITPDYIPTIKEIKSKFNESMEFLGLDPLRFKNIINRNLPDRIQNNRKIVRQRRKNIVDAPIHQGFA